MSPENRTPSSDQQFKATPGLITEVPKFGRDTTEPGSAEVAEASGNLSEQTPAQKQRAYMDTLADRHDFDVEDTVSILTLERSADAEHPQSWADPGWTLESYGQDEKRGVVVGLFTKGDLQKMLPLEKALAYSAEAAEIARAKTPQVELADRAMKITGPANPEAIEPFSDPFSDAMSKADFEAVRAKVDQVAPQAEVSEVIVDKIDGLSDGDRADVLQYRNLSSEQFRAHREGDFLASKDLKEAAFTLRRRMSTAAVDAIYN